MRSEDAGWSNIPNTLRNPGCSQEGGDSARFKSQVGRLEEELRQRQLEYAEAVALRDALSAREAMLVSFSSKTELLQQIMVKTVWLRSPFSDIHRHLPTSTNSLRFQTLPSSLALYDDSLIHRIAGMSVGDVVCVYSDFMST